MDMEPSSREQSPPYSDNSNMPLWNWSQLNAESSAGLCGLMEDKEIAARAVAFVVNSTRKGIVPLCADVANLMRSKQCLEQKLQLIRHENDAFRSSLSGGSLPSHSMSPTPPSLSSYTEQCIKSLQEQSAAVQEHFRSSSRCSNSSSTYSYSPKLEIHKGGAYNYSPKSDNPRGVSLRPHGVQYSPASSTDSRKHNSPRLLRSTLSAFRESREKPRGHANFLSLAEDKHRHESDDTCVDIDMTMDIVKDFSSEIFSNIEQLNRKSLIEPEKVDTTGDVKDKGYTRLHIEDETKTDASDIKTETSIQTAEQRKCEEKPKLEVDGEEEFGPGSESKTLLERRRVSLPEITTIPNIRAIRIRPKQSKEVQCCLDKTVEDLSIGKQFMESSRVNARLQEELRAARREIDQLRARLTNFETCGAIPKTSTQTEEERTVEDNGYYTGSNRTSRTGSEHERISLFKKPSGKRQTITSVTYAGPLPNCKCSGCLETLGSDDDISHYSDTYLDEPNKFAVSSKLQVQIDDHVATKGGHTGYIRYIGHVDKTDQSQSLFVGLELDTAGGNCDGNQHGKHYFYCKTNHGLFVPLTDVTHKVNRKVQQKCVKEDNVKVKKTFKKTNKDDKVTRL